MSGMPYGVTLEVPEADYLLVCEGLTRLGIEQRIVLISSKKEDVKWIILDRKLTDSELTFLRIYSPVVMETENPYQKLMVMLNEAP